MKYKEKVGLVSFLIGLWGMGQDIILGHMFWTSFVIFFIGLVMFLGMKGEKEK